MDLSRSEMRVLVQWADSFFKKLPPAISAPGRGEVFYLAGSALSDAIDSKYLDDLEGEEAEAKLVAIQSEVEVQEAQKCYRLSKACYEEAIKSAKADDLDDYKIKVRWL